MTRRVVLILGGARSGKSAAAEAIAESAGGGVTYIATGGPADIERDASWADRVTAHRARRPAHWTTVEVGADLALSSALDEAEGTVLVDSLGAWVARAPAFAVDAAALRACLARRAGTTVLVSDEVGLGVVPETAIGGAFRDALGDLNRAVAEVADDVYLVVAGRRLRLESP